MKYDVFISYKSEDFRIATSVHKFLTDNGLSVFFSQETLGNIGDSEYSAIIDHALENSNHMIVIASNPEYLTHGWVHYEWSTFSNELRCGYKTGNLITILTPGVQLSSLPVALRHRQSFTTKSYADNILGYLKNSETTQKVETSLLKRKLLYVVCVIAAVFGMSMSVRLFVRYNTPIYPVIISEYTLDFSDSNVVSYLASKLSSDFDYEAISASFDLAKSGSGEAQYQIGSYCYDIEAYDDALYWFVNSAIQGNPSGANGIGRCYYNARGVIRRPRYAYNWFLLSAKNGCPEGMNNVGKCLEEGFGVIVPHKKKAIKYYKSAADLGHVSAQYNVGVHYFFGNGVKENVDEGLKWIRIAAHNGSASAQYTLGNIYSQGLKGVKVDMDVALHWYNKVMENSDEYIKSKTEQILLSLP